MAWIFGLYTIYVPLLPRDTVLLLWPHLYNIHIYIYKYSQCHHDIAIYIYNYARRMTFNQTAQRRRCWLQNATLCGTVPGLPGGVYVYDDDGPSVFLSSTQRSARICQEVLWAKKPTRVKIERKRHARWAKHKTRHKNPKAYPLSTRCGGLTIACL